MRRKMDSARRMAVSDRYVKSIVRGVTDTVPRLADSVAFVPDPMGSMSSPNRHLTDAMRPTTSRVGP